ncbi:MAG: flippase-like domain-containing protein [Xanthomonadales bacterium]|nr:flippase-like domain-containing protein [Xanthomonadales bacterium]
MNRAALLRLVLAILVTMVCVVVFLRYFDVSQVMAKIAASNPRNILLGAAIAAVTINLRGLRLCLCVSGRLISSLLPIAYIFNGLSALLPAKLGEVSLPLLLRHQSSTSISMGVGVLLLLRVLDLLALLLVGAVPTAIALHENHAGLSWAAWAVAGCSLLGILVLILAGPPLARYIHGHGSSDHALVRLASRLASPVAHMRRAHLLQLVVLTLAIWISLFTSFVVLAHATLSEVGGCQIAAAGTAASLAFAVPASAIANVGPFQIAWVWALVGFGHAPGSALASALVVHGVIFVVSMLFGLVGYVALAGFKAH